MTRSQVKIIDHFLKEIFNDNINDLEKLNIKIDTVDNFQGREKEIIFVDLVRAHGSYEHEKNKIDYNQKRNLKFYMILERLNVAFSRAKAKMIIVGAFKNHLLDEKTISSSSSNGF
jgi:superfamily I DNA and/or RNA helicase